MSIGGMLDDIARALGEPMPRRSAVRLIGASLAALAVPGMLPRTARGAAAQEPRSCPEGQRRCDVVKEPGGEFVRNYCCPFPEEQWSCGDKDNGHKCRNHCPRFNRAINKNQKPTWGAKLSNGRRPYNCCVIPDTVPREGECLPNCRYLYLNHLAPGPTQCGSNCCPSYQRCEDGECKPCATNTCQPAVKGEPRCCPKGTECCANETTTACCGEKQTCKAAGRKVATCDCPSGTKKCGPDCCEKQDSCCGGTECCPKGRCFSGKCCPPDHAVCTDSDGNNPVCCDKDEFCLWKTEVDGELLHPFNSACKRGCAPGNRAGKHCCGTGYKPNRKKTACVLE